MAGTVRQRDGRDAPVLAFAGGAVSGLGRSRLSGGRSAEVDRRGEAGVGWAIRVRSKASKCQAGLEIEET